MRFVLGAVVAVAIAGPAFAGETPKPMNATEAQSFVTGKVFAFTCFDGTRGAGRVFGDGSAAGKVQFGGSGPERYMRVPANTLQVRGEAVCASLKGLPFSPCFDLQKSSERSFRGSVSGMGFAYCDFHRHGTGHIIMARSLSSHRASRPRSLHAPGVKQEANASRAAQPVTVGSAVTSELRRSTD
ncbi:MAG: hypothetical protein WBA66_13365 [Xanthobacteraceae bacterium]